MSATEQALVSLSPVETLVFQLEKDVSPRAVLRVTNTSQNKVVFKVKTTQPSWYYVRPNQQVVDIGKTEEVAIVLVDAECTRFLENAAAGRPEKLEKHRFLVQTKTLEDAEYESIVSSSAQQRADAFARIWNEGPKDDRKNLKLKVDFTYPSDLEQFAPRGNSSSTNNNAGHNNTNPSEQPVRSVSENVDLVRNRLARSSNPDGSIGSPSSRGNPGADDPTMMASPESLFAELQNLRKKYDAVVEYTVHLTAERDTIVQRLEETEKELTREVGRRRAQQSESPKGARKTDKSTDKKVAQKGFSVTAVLLAALICFLVGRYYKF